MPVPAATTTAVVPKPDGRGRAPADDVAVLPLEKAVRRGVGTNDLPVLDVEGAREPGRGARPSP